MSGARRRMATRTCSLQRVEIVSQTGLSSDAADEPGLQDLPSTYLLPMDPRAIERAKAREFGGNVSLYLVYVFGDYAINEGDLMTFNGETKQYPVREAIPWRHGEVFVECIVEEVKGTTVSGDWQR